MEQIHAGKNIAYALLGWVLNSISLFGGAWLQYSSSNKTDDYADNGGFLLSWYWSVNPVCYLAGSILCIGCFVLIWKTILRGTLRGVLTLKKGWTPIWFLLMLLAMTVQLLLYFIGLFLNVEFFDTPDPEWTPAFIFVYLGIILLTVIAETIRFRRQNRQQAG